MKKVNLALIASIMAFIASVVAICVSLDAFSLSDTAYLGWIIAVLSTIVVVLIGWDIYKGVDIDRKIDDGIKKNHEFTEKLKKKLADLDFFGSETSTSLSKMVISKQIVHVSGSGTQVFSITSVAVNDMAFVVIFTAKYLLRNKMTLFGKNRIIPFSMKFIWVYIKRGKLFI